MLPEFNKAFDWWCHVEWNEMNCSITLHRKQILSNFFPPPSHYSKASTKQVSPTQFFLLRPLINSCCLFAIVWGFVSFVSRLDLKSTKITKHSRTQVVLCVKRHCQLWGNLGGSIEIKTKDKVDRKTEEQAKIFSVAPRQKLNKGSFMIYQFLNESLIWNATDFTHIVD